jgi:hypothetical protein
MMARVAAQVLLMGLVTLVVSDTSDLFMALPTLYTSAVQNVSECNVPLGTPCDPRANNEVSIRVSISGGNRKDGTPASGDHKQQITVLYDIYTINASYPHGWGWATPGVDYVAVTGGNLTFDPAVLFQDISLTLIADGVFEQPDEMIAIRLYDLSIGNETIDPSSNFHPNETVAFGANGDYAAVRIKDPGDAGFLQFSHTSYSFMEPESDKVVAVTVTRIGGSSTAITVQAEIKNDASIAIGGADFEQLTQTEFSFAENQTVTVIPITLKPDTEFEYVSGGAGPDEYFILRLTGVTPVRTYEPGVSVGTLTADPLKKQTTVKILDDGDGGTLSFTASDYYGREDASFITVTITRTGGWSTSCCLDATVQIQAVGVSATAGMDFSTALVGGPANEVGSDPKGGAYLECNKYGYSKCVRTTQAGSGTIQKINWPDKITRLEIDIPIQNDLLYEAVDEVIRIELVSPLGGPSLSATRNSTLVHILDDRDAGTLSFRNSSYTVSESGTQVAVTVTRTGIANAINSYVSGNVSVQISSVADEACLPSEVTDGTCVITDRKCDAMSPCIATANMDYVPVPPTTLHFTDGVDRRVFLINITNDDLFEAPDEVFKLKLSNVSGGAHIAQNAEHPGNWNDTINLPPEAGLPRQNDLATTLVTIQDDFDPAILLSRASVATTEHGFIDYYDVSLNSRPTHDVTITMHGSAKLYCGPGNPVLAGCDLARPPSELKLWFAEPRWQLHLTFEPAQYNVSQRVYVAAVDDSEDEDQELHVLRHTSNSYDSHYRGDVRTELNQTGTVYATRIYKSDPRALFQGLNPWLASEGILTAPSNNTVNAIVNDNDHAAVLVESDRSRFNQLLNGSETAVSVRLKGFSSFYTVKLLTNPTAHVTVTVLNPPSALQLSPSHVVFGRENWSTPQTINVRVRNQTVLSSTTKFQIRHRCNSSDPFYDDSSSRTVPILPGPITVLAYDAVAVQLHQTAIALQENGNGSTYQLELKSEPMHFEQHNASAAPFSMRVYADRDTTLHRGGANNTALGAAGTLSVANQVSQLVNDSAAKRVALLNFPLTAAVGGENVISLCGGPRVGTARLRLYRLGGGENGGVLGVGVSVVRVSSVDALSRTGWEEGKMCWACVGNASGLDRSECTGFPNNWTNVDINAYNAANRTYTNGTADPRINGTGRAYVEMPVLTSSQDASVITSTYVNANVSANFNQSANVYMPEQTGWMELDVTAAVNDALAAGVDNVTFMLLTNVVADRLMLFSDQIHFASREHATVSQRPHLQLVPSGTTNVAYNLPDAQLKQSVNLYKSAVVDGIVTPTNDMGFHFQTVTQSSWYQIDLGLPRNIFKVTVHYMKRNPNQAVLNLVDFWMMLSNSDLEQKSFKAGYQENGFQAAFAAAEIKKQFSITRSTDEPPAAEGGKFATASSTWIVGDTLGGLWDAGRFVPLPGAAPAVEPVMRYFFLQLLRVNALPLAEIQIFQPAPAQAEVAVGGYIPSPSTLSSRNQLSISPNQTCDEDTLQCRAVLSFTAGNWRTPQTVTVAVVDDHVASGPRVAALTHTVSSVDRDYRGKSIVTPRSSISVSITEDDIAGITLSKRSLSAVEGAHTYPSAAKFPEVKQLQPVQTYCNVGAQTLAACGLSTDGRKATAWRAVLSTDHLALNKRVPVVADAVATAGATPAVTPAAFASSALPSVTASAIDKGAAFSLRNPGGVKKPFLLVELDPTQLALGAVNKIEILKPAGVGVAGVRTLSLRESNSYTPGAESYTWVAVPGPATFAVPFGSTGVDMNYSVSGFSATSKYLMVVVEEVYHDYTSANQLVVDPATGNVLEAAADAPVVEVSVAEFSFFATHIKQYPAQRGNWDVASTGISRMNLQSKPSFYSVVLDSEPLSEVVIWPMVSDRSQLVAWDKVNNSYDTYAVNATNGSAGTGGGALYSSSYGSYGDGQPTPAPTAAYASFGSYVGSYVPVPEGRRGKGVLETLKFADYGTVVRSAKVVSSLTFNASSWNVPQIIEVRAVDNNVASGNRSLYLVHISSSEDKAATVVQQSATLHSFNSRYTSVGAEHLYNGIQRYHTATGRVGQWPYARNITWESTIGNVKVGIQEDDVPGVTFSKVCSAYAIRTHTHTHPHTHARARTHCTAPNRAALPIYPQSLTSSRTPPPCLPLAVPPARRGGGRDAVLPRDARLQADGRGERDAGLGPLPGPRSAGAALHRVLGRRARGRHLDDLPAVGLVSAADAGGERVRRRRVRGPARLHG